MALGSTVTLGYEFFMRLVAKSMATEFHVVALGSSIPKPRISQNYSIYDQCRTVAVGHNFFAATIMVFSNRKLYVVALGPIVAASHRFLWCKAILWLQATRNNMA